MHWHNKHRALQDALLWVDMKETIIDDTRLLNLFPCNKMSSHTISGYFGFFLH